MVMARLEYSKNTVKYNYIIKVLLMKKTFANLLPGICLVGLIACGAPNKALISQSEIDNAQKAGTLNTLYDKAAGFVSQSKGSSKKEALALQSKISQLLVSGATKKVNQLLSSYKKDKGGYYSKEPIRYASRNNCNAAMVSN